MPCKSSIIISYGKNNSMKGIFMADYIIRATAAEGYIRAFAAVTTSLVQQAREIHNTYPVASAALGRTLTAAGMMSLMLKNDNDVLTIQVKGDGPLGGIVVAADSRANVRGYVYNPDVEVPLNDKGKLDVGSAVGANGYISVIKDLGLKEPYIGYVRLVSGEIAEDIAYYFAVSEQTPSVVSLGVLVSPDGNILNSGGFIIQLLPDAGEETISFLEKKIQDIPPMTSLLSQGKTPEDILEIILGELGLVINGKYPVNLKCNCSRERMKRNLLSLGTKELLEIIEDQHKAELVCHFCNSRYEFNEEQLRELVNLLNNRQEEQ